MKNITKLFILIAVASLFSCKQQNFYITDASSASSAREVSIEQLDPPRQLSVSTIYSDTIKISWAPVYGAESYLLQRAIVTDGKEPSDDDYEIIRASATSSTGSSYITGTQYEDKILTSPKYNSPEYNYQYYYRVRAENAKMGYTESTFLDCAKLKDLLSDKKKESDWNIAENKKAADDPDYKRKPYQHERTFIKGSLFPPPATISATAGSFTDQIVIKWSPVPGATRYNIYRSDDEFNTTPIPIYSVTKSQTEYTHSIASAYQGVEYYYSVEAVNGGNSSIKSALAMGFARKNNAPGQVQNVQVKENAGRGDSLNSIEIEWDAMSDVYYAVYRSSSSDSTLMQLAPKLTTNSYKDTKNLNRNTYYYYKVLAYKYADDGTTQIKGQISNSSQEDKNEFGTSSAAEGFVLSPPTDVTVTKAFDNPVTYQIKFALPIGAERYLNDSKLYNDYKNYTYEIYGGRTVDSISTLVSTSEHISPYGYCSVLTTDLYKFYKVKTIYNGLESADSMIAAPSPEPAKNVKATKAAFIEGYTEFTYTYTNAEDTKAPSGNNKFNKNQVYPVKITWEEPDGGADGGYNIYRSTNSVSGFRKINDNPVFDLFYVDENDSAKAQIYYYYYVLSLNSLKQGANPSNLDIGYGALTHNQYMREYNKTIQRSQAKLTLMHKSKDTDKLGSETISGDVCGTLTYTSSIAGLGATIKMPYTNYCDFEILNELTNKYDYKFFVNGNTNTDCNMSANGNMSGTMRATNCMYPGVVVYDKVEIKGGNAGGGYYTITPDGFKPVQVDYLVGNEGWNR